MSSTTAQQKRAQKKAQKKACEKVLADRLSALEKDLNKTLAAHGFSARMDVEIGGSYRINLSSMSSRAPVHAGLKISPTGEIFAEE